MSNNWVFARRNTARQMSLVYSGCLAIRPSRGNSLFRLYRPLSMIDFIGTSISFEFQDVDTSNFSKSQDFRTSISFEFQDVGTTDFFRIPGRWYQYRKCNIVNIGEPVQ